jgi:ATP-dependent DNA helicase RecG
MGAVMHRSYDGTSAPIRVTWFEDRVEIQSPGGPFGRITRENFGQPGANDYRNSYLAEAMKYLGHVQRFGFGITQARQEMEKNRNPALEFQVEEFHVGVVLRKRT